MNNITKIDENNCTGCCLCQNVCPVNAISMEESQEGFIYPHVDLVKCVDCGKCLNYCPTENPEYHNFPNPVCHAINANNEIRKEASSGGIFSSFADLLIRDNGIAYGAAYNDDFSVEFKKAENLQELALARLESEDATLKELGEMMTPPIGKSGVNHRLRKISEIAEELRGC